jgi:transcriptional regulator with XRE-family HTH domain
MNTRSPGPLDKALGARIRLHRRAARPSQQALGRRTGMTCQQVQKYENRLDRIAATRLWDLAQVLGVPIEGFFAGIKEGEDVGDLPAASGLGGAMEVPEFAALVRLFPRVKDPAMRRRVVELVETLAEAGGEPA